MRVLWDSNEYVIVLTGLASFDDDPGFEGFATSKGIMHKWEAFPTPNGYYIKVYRRLSYLGAVHGATFNLGLEVMSAINRIG